MRHFLSIPPSEWPLLPRLGIAVLMILGGLWAATAAAKFLERHQFPAPREQREALTGVLRALILLIAVLAALDQTGIDLSLLFTVLVVLLGALLLSGALAIGVGARTMVSNAIACFYLRKIYKVGNVVELAGIEGTVVSISGAFVVLETREGQFTVPAKAFAESPSRLLRPGR